MRAIEFSDTYYARTAVGVRERPVLRQPATCDVAVVGGGLAGLTTARELLRAAKSVVVLEGRRCGWGASGRNGGFVGAGYALGTAAIRRRVGDADARALYALSVDGVAYIRRTVRELAVPGAAPTPGMLRVIRYPGAPALAAHRETMAAMFGRSLEYWPREVLRERLCTARYHAGLYDPDGFHFHPLNYVHSLAADIERLGGVIHEGTPVTAVAATAAGTRLTTPQSHVTAGQVVFCCGGYTGRVERRLAAAILPIATSIILTAPLGPRLGQAVRIRAAVFDDRRASDYYRIVDDDRLLWGGRISARRAQPRQLAALLKRDLLAVYPQLGDVTVEAAWSGLMGYARHMMPQIGRLPGGAWYCTAFGGHGLNTTAAGGQLIAAAIAHGDDRYRLFAPFGLSWNGGVLGRPAAQLTYWAGALRDRLRERPAA